jgi:hypothetical protein
VVAITSVLALGAWSVAGPAVGFSSPSVTKCLSPQLALKFVSFQGATGHRFWQLAFKNLASTCSLHGFPRVVLLNGAGHVIPTTVTHEAGPVPTVTVMHGNRGHFTFSYTDGGFCSHHFLAARMKLFPPSEPGGFVFNPVPANHGQINVCTGSEKVSPVRAHPDG